MPASEPRLSLDMGPDAMVIIDAAGTIRFVNHQLCELFSYSREQMIGRSVEMLMPERFQQRHRLHRAEYTTCMRARPMGQGLALYGRRHDGTEFPLEISLSPIDHDSAALIVAAIRDVSDRRRIQAELIAARNAAEEAKQIAVRASGAKSRFLATASHDLRQPLQTLALLNGALRRMAHDADSVGAVAQQEAAITVMSRLVNTLLDICKLESGTVKPDPRVFPVRALFEAMEREFAGAASGKGLKLQIETSSACVHSDRSLVEQLLRNLLSNAIKYTHRGTVALRCMLLPDSLVRLEVIDTGIGIAADQLPYICDEFYQAGVPPTGTRDGYGLGLAIVKRIVDLLAVKLEVASAPGQGSSFSFLLPAASAPTTVSSQVTTGAMEAAVPRGTMAGPRVLLVEDDPSVRDATRALLRSEGYRVTAVASCKEALSAAVDEIDLLLTDYHLGEEGTGTEVIAAMRAALGGHLKCVLFTGDTSSTIRGLPLDPDLRIANKPLSAEQLLKLMGDLLAVEVPQPS